jgi:hypothetical protein
MEYFDLFSHYTVRVTDVLEKRGTIVLLGTAAGIHVNPKSKERTRWKVPAAWKAVVSKGKICEWRVFACARILSSSVARVTAVHILGRLPRAADRAILPG